MLYQPLSEVIHYEGARAALISQPAQKNTRISTDRRSPKRGPTELRQNRPLAIWRFCVSPRLADKNIFVIDHHLPMPDKDAGSVRMFHILNILHQLGHRVTFIPDNLANIPPYGDELQKRGIEIIYHPYIKKVRDYLISHGPEFDAVVLSRCDFARKHIADIRLYAPQSRIIFDTVDLHFVRTGSRGPDHERPGDARKGAPERRAGIRSH